MYHPYISAKSAEGSERTCWSAVVRDVWPRQKGENCLCVITDDYKKKIWPLARIGQLGVNTQVLLFDSGRLQLQNLVVDWGKLIDVLDFIETVYAAGFNKQAISESLFICYAALIEHSKAALDWESKLVELRKTPEFNVAVLIAQKPLVQKEVDQLKLL